MEFNQVHKAVRSAMSGNGKFKVNWEIRRMKRQLHDEFEYDKQKFDDLTLDYTLAMLENHVVKDKFDPERGNLNAYLTVVTRNYLLNTMKKHRREKDDWIKYKAGEIRECDVVSQYDTDIDKFIENQVSGIGNLIGLRPDQIYELNELIEIIKGNLTGVDLMVFQERLTQRGAADLLKVSLGKYNQQYNNNIGSLITRLSEGGYL